MVTSIPASLDVKAEDVWVGGVESTIASIDESGVGELMVIWSGVVVGVGVAVGFRVGDAVAVGWGVA